MADDITLPTTALPEDMAKRIAQYIQVRDRIKEIEDETKAKLRPLRDVQEVLSGIIQGFMDTHNLENLKTEHGTCYKSTRHTASLADPEAFMNYVIQNGKFDLLDRRANATAVKDFVAANKALPPGCNLTAIQSLGVRRKGSGGGDAD